MLDRNTPVFGLSTRQIGDRVRATTQAAGLSAGLTGHSGRVVMAQDLVKSGAELPTLMTAGRWESFTIPARYTERQAADGGGGPSITREGGQASSQQPMPGIRTALVFRNVDAI